MNRKIATWGVSFLAGWVLLFGVVRHSSAALFLEMPATGVPGKSFSASIGFTDTANILSFELIVSFQSGTILTTGVDKFTANQTFFPETAIAGVLANFLSSPISGKIYVVGLAPGSVTGKAKIGDLVFNVLSSAPPGDAQIVTLSGKIYTNSGEVQSLSPVSKTITFAAFNDSDNDQMDDQWEIDHFGNLVRDGSGDFDMDGLTDLQEYQAGTNPTVFDSGYLTPGDIDNSKTVDLSDAIIGLQISSGMPVSKPVYKGTDINQDGKIGIAELIYILQKIANNP